LAGGRVPVGHPPFYSINLATTERTLAIEPRPTTCMEMRCGGKPQKPRLTEKPVAVVKWVDGTVLDTVWQVGS
jgi:citrate lyase alpha subunit